MEDSILVDISHSSTHESWIVVKSDGTIIYHRENDGYRALKRGLEPIDESITLEDVAKRFPDKLSEIKEALDKIKNK